MGRRFLPLGLAISLVIVLAVAGALPVLADVAPETTTTTTGAADAGAVPLLLIAVVAAVALVVSLGYLSRADRRRQG